jgi:rhamnogalacturonan endolyase
MMQSDQKLISFKFCVFINLFQGYQFWTQADVEGHFIIKNVLPGEYNLYAWVPGFIGDYKNDTKITINPG